MFGQQDHGVDQQSYYKSEEASQQKERSEDESECGQRVSEKVQWILAT